MDVAASLTLAQLCAALQQQTTGLYYMSESEFPFEVISFVTPAGQAPASTDLWVMAGQPAGVPIEVVSLADFFRSRTQVRPGADAEEVRVAQGLGKLQVFLEQHLQAVQVYCIGRRKITALIVGQSPGQGFAGLKTQVIAT